MNAALEKRIKRQVIGKPHRFMAVVPLGFEQTLINEFLDIGIETTADLEHKTCDKELSHPERPFISGDGKVEFTAKLTEAWKAVAYSRIANRILMEIGNFKAENFRDFEKKASEIPWELYLDVRRETKDERNIPSNSKLVTRNSINIHVTCKHSRLYHSDAIAERLQKIIEGVSLPLTPADTASATPSAGTPRNAPTQNLYVHFLDDRCTIWQDLAGEELYKRGHERFVNEAPLKETIASAMIFEAFHFLPSTSYCLLDLMAGSGTFSLEAAYIANHLIPGTCRDFALKHQPAFKEATWKFLIRRETKDERREKCATVTLASHVIASTQCEAIHQPIITKIITSDISERAIEIIKHNVECSPLADIAPSAINPKIRDFFSYTAEEIANACKSKSHPIIILNPPYGKRLDFDAPRLYTRIGRKLKELAHDLNAIGMQLTVAILSPKDDTRNGAKYTCTANLLHECPSLSPEHNSTAKLIVTSHGGFSLNVFIAKI